MFRYVVVQEDLFSPEIGHYHSFGICAINERGERAAFVSDVSTNRNVAAEIASRCTAGQLDPKHLSDVVLNFI